MRRGFVALMVVIALGARGAWAQVGSDRYSSIVIDAGSGNVLSAASPDEPRYPASLTKMMTLYLVFEALRDNRLSLTSLVSVSPQAASMMPSKLGLIPGRPLYVEEAILGLVTKSANDAAAALGELLGGDEERFAQMMTLRARALGMRNTVFRNASGLPDPDQTTTARDLATLARHLVQDFPLQYRYFSTPSFVFHGHTILNHDRMLVTYPGADGIKTGYIEASGQNLVTSAVHGDVRLIGVVLGAASSAERDAHMASLLDAGFDRMGAPPMVARVDPPPSRVPSLIGQAQAAPYARGYYGQEFASQGRGGRARLADMRMALGGRPRIEAGRGTLTRVSAQTGGRVAALPRPPVLVLPPTAGVAASRGHGAARLGATTQTGMTGCGMSVPWRAPCLVRHGAPPARG